MDIDITTGLALYGALLSTIVFLWNLRRNLRDRAKLIVEADHHVLIGPLHRDHKLGIKMVNKGRRPLTVVASGFRLSTQSDENMVTVLDPTLPKELTEGQSHTTYANPMEVEANMVLYAWTRDATGRIYRSKKWPLRSKKS